MSPVTGDDLLYFWNMDNRAEAINEERPAVEVAGRCLKYLMKRK